MRRFGEWTQSGALCLLMVACNGGGGGATASQSGAGDTDTGDTDPGEPTTTQGGATDSGQVTGVSGTDSDATGTASAGTTETSGPDQTTGPGPDSTSTSTSTGGSTSTTDPGTTTEGVETGTGTEGETEGETGAGPCELLIDPLPCDGEDNDPLHAIGLNCSSLGPPWENNVNAIAASNFDIQAAPLMDGMRPYQVARSYGTYVDPDTDKPFWGPREGEKVLLISSGLLPPPNDAGAVIVEDGFVYNDVAFGGQWDTDVMPPPMSPIKGSPDPNGFVDCDGVNDCSNTLWDQWQYGEGSPDDKMWFSFELTAPGFGPNMMAKGFSFDFAFFSAEFPEFVDTEYNDIMVVWQSSEDYTGNITFIDGQPLTVTALWPVEFIGDCEGVQNCLGFDPHLAGTGHIADGGATGWYKATGGVNPGETFTLTFAIFDMFDSIYDTTALVDNWQWDCEGCVSDEIMSCDVAPQ